jgi:hypothetical protein
MGRGILGIVALLSFLLLTSCAIRDLEVTPIDTTSTEPITVNSPVKAHLTDGSTVVFEKGVTVVDGHVTGEGRKYDVTLDTSVRVSSVALDVSADRNPRLCAAVRFQSENQVVVNTAYRAADFVPVSVRTQA